MTAAVPLVELHCHIEGAARPELVRRLARGHGIDLSHVFALDGTYLAGDFTRFLEIYDEVDAVFRTAEDYVELAADHFGALAEQGAIYGEVFASPAHAASLGMSWPVHVEAIVQGLERAQERHDIEGRIVATGVRHFGPDSVLEAAQTVARHPHAMVTGFGLAGDERQHHPRDFAAAFDVAREAGLGLTAHAGEFAGAQSVADALDYLRVSRIGHGVRAAEDEALVDRLVAERIVLEVCPGSNLALGVYEDAADHPLGRLWDAGVRVTLNSDDPPFFHTDLTAEYAFAAREKRFERADLLEVSRIAIEAAFVDEATRARLLAKLS